MRLKARPGVLLGRFDGEWLVSRDASHIGVFAKTGSGKDQSLIMPIAVTYPSCLVIVDPKDGEVYQHTQRWRRSMSDVSVFAPRHDGSQGAINVLDYIRLGTMHEWGDVGVIISSLLAPEKLVRESDSGVHFRQMGETLAKGATLHTLYASGDRSLPGVLRFVSGFKGKIPDLLAALLTSHHLGTEVHALIAEVAGELSPIADREMSGIWSTMLRGLHPYRDPIVSDHTSQSTIRLDTLQTGSLPTTLYLVAPSVQELGEMQPVFRVVLETLAWVTTRQGLTQARYPLVLLWNEFPSFGWVRQIEKDIATLRGYGWRIALFCQDLDQLWNIYGEKTGIWGNLGTKIFHAPANDQVAKRVCETMIGWRTVERLVPQYRRTRWRQRVSGYTTQRHEELLLRPEEFRQWEDEYVLFVEGCPPARVGKLWWNTDPVLLSRGGQ